MPTNTVMEPNATTSLREFRLAALVEDRFEQVELTGPKEAFERAGCKVDIVSRHARVTGMNHDAEGDSFDTNVALSQARPEDYHALLLPGGVVNGDRLRLVPEAQEFVRAIARRDKPIAVICHGGWILISCDLVRNRTVTSWPTLQDDYRNAGAHWVDQPVVVDGNLISSRKPDDIPDFSRAALEVFAQAQAYGKKAA